ncbi:E3 SUMO-protein ligase PIAS3-like [Melanaphis sacchari]|uniref:E3 SUMO-protein ligase PIAS3-like n=1 Tax=Melanaphis sacchari TaxID=742174 RepID=UPI000DC1329A|nr:E3 SUMO-protein ligase PIAS3-like [Melanaphis sacchari]
MNSKSEGTMDSISEKVHRTMLDSFRMSDLQRLLEAFGQNKEGRRIELRNRALELLRSRPNDFDFVAYLSKIEEIYKYKEFCARNFIHPRQEQMMYMRHMHTPLQRMYPRPRYHPQQQRMYPLPHYLPRQPIHMTRPGLSQYIIRKPRGVHGNPTGQNIIPENTMANNNIRYALGSFQPAEPHAIVPSQLPLDQQNTMRFAVNASTSINNNVITSSLQTVTNYKFKKLPFFEVIDNIIDPTILEGTEKCTLGNLIKGSRECMFTHTMTNDQVTLIAMNRDISYGKKEYLFQYQIRICQIKFGYSGELTDYFPLELCIRIGNKTCPLPPKISNRIGVEARRIAKPINISHFLKLNPMLENSITVNWFPDGKRYALALFIVRKLSPDDLIKKLQKKEARSSEETKNNIIKKLAVSDSDIVPTSYRFSLVCPLGKIRMKIPAKSIHCDHIQCFDAGTFILMNEKKPTWMCPTCNKPCLYEDIRIENYFLEIVTSPKLENDSMEIEILADGSWIVFKENKNTENMNIILDTQENLIDYIDLDDSDNEISIDPKKELGSKVSEGQKCENLKPHLVGLTLDENEEPSKNEVREAHVIQLITNAIQPVTDAIQPMTDFIQPVTDAIQPITIATQPITEVELKPQVQVQPQQAYTSSE